MTRTELHCCGLPDCTTTVDNLRKLHPIMIITPHRPKFSSKALLICEACIESIFRDNPERINQRQLITLLKGWSY